MHQIQFKEFCTSQETKSLGLMPREATANQAVHPSAVGNFVPAWQGRQSFGSNAKEKRLHLHLHLQAFIADMHI